MTDKQVSDALSEEETQGENDQRGHSAWDSLGIFVTRLLARPFTIFISLLTAIYLGPEDKGIVAWIGIVLLAASNVFSFGCGAAVKYYVSKGIADMREFAWTSLMMGLANGLVASVILWALFEFNGLGRVSSDLPAIWKLLMLVLIPLMSIRLILFLALMGDSRFRVVNRLELAISVIHSLLLTGLVIVADLGLEGAATSLIASQTLISALTIAIVFRTYRPRLRLDFSQAVATYSYGVRTWFGSLCNQLNLSLDSLLVGMVAPAAILGNYSVAVTISRSLMIIPTSLGPVLTNRLVKQNPEERAQSVSRIHRLVLAAMVVLAILVGVAGYTLLPHLMSDYDEVPHLLAILLVGTLFLSSFSVLSCYFHGSGAPGKPSIAQMVAFAMGAFLTPALAWFLGGIGAAIASSATYAVSMFVLLLIYRKPPERSLKSLYRLVFSDWAWLRKQWRSIQTRLPMGRARRASVETSSAEES